MNFVPINTIPIPTAATMNAAIKETWRGESWPIIVKYVERCWKGLVKYRRADRPKGFIKLMLMFRKHCANT
ncbi:MAG: hypothetical protein M3R08_08155, partial [Bacteroidota bacterium]|nr:hypothetical protein [Bacteroidota bacterium]